MAAAPRANGSAAGACRSLGWSCGLTLATNAGHSTRTLHAAYATHAATFRRSRHQSCQAAQVLGDGRECELELDPARSAQSQSTEPEDALEVSKQHLDAFDKHGPTYSIVAGVFFGFTENTSDVVLKLTPGAWNSDSANVAADLGTWVASHWLRRNVRADC